MKALLLPVLARVRASRSWKKGQTLAEYALIMAILSIVAVAVYGLLDTQIAKIFSGIANILDSAQSNNVS
jgi:Flp pilus assembly pilin Flp